MPPFSTLAYLMSKNWGPESYRYVQKWQNLTKTLRHVFRVINIKCNADTTSTLT